MSDVKLHLTQSQYQTLLNLSQSVSRVFAIESEPEPISQIPVVASTPSSDSIHSSINLEPELRITDATRKVWATVDLVVSVNAVKLHLYDMEAVSESNLQQHGIARFALNNNTLRYKSLSDGAVEAQLIIRSFTMGNTKPGHTRFREIIPAAQHDRNQFMVLYSATSGPSGTALAVVSIDSPQIIFSIDPVFALLEFFTAQTRSDSQDNESVNQTSPQSEASATDAQRVLDFRLDLHDVAISVLENDQDPNTRAISLSIQQILISQQVRGQPVFLSDPHSV